MNRLTVVPLRCGLCGSQRNLERCNVCKRPICPKCRWGLGSVTDGYTCIDACALTERGGFSGVQRIPPLEKGERFLVTLAIIGVVALATFLIIYALTRQPWHD